MNEEMSLDVALDIVSENVRLSVMDKIQNLYTPRLKAYYAAQ